MQVFERDFIYKTIPQLTKAIDRLADSVNRPKLIELHNGNGSIFVNSMDITAVYANDGQKASDGHSLVFLSDGTSFHDVIEGPSEIFDMIRGGNSNGR